MITNRREFLKLGAAAGAGLFLGRFNAGRFTTSGSTAFASYSGASLRKFAQPLRGVFPLDPNGIPVAVPDGQRAWGAITAQHYTIDINQYQDTLHPNLGPTTLRGYHSRANLGGTPPQRHLGGIIVAHRGTPVQITFQNNLTGSHPLPIDSTIMGAEDGPNRVVTHLHGGLVPWISDGGPFAWFDSAGHYGPSAAKGSLNIYKILNPQLKPGQAEFYYPNGQSARMVWYHDHAVGITRLNAYGGIASAFVIRDIFEDTLRDLGLPDFIENGGREIPIVIQDKIFVGTDITTGDPTWTGVATPGSLWYPHVYEPDKYTLAPGGRKLPKVSAIPEMFGDTMMANGVVFPFAPVEPRRYRLRVLNACQARFLNLQLYEDDGSGRPDTHKPGPDFLVIGTEGGFLARPVVVPSNRPMKYLSDGSSVDPTDSGGSLITAPAERWDILIDFKGFEGKHLILANDAPAPFPGGDSSNDDQGSNDNGPDTHTIMRFDVAAGISGAPDSPLHITPRTYLALNRASLIDQPLSGFWSLEPLPPPPGVKVRHLTLNEVFDEYGRLIQMLGTNQAVPLPHGFSMDESTPDRPRSYARRYTDAATETVHHGDVEVWQIANLTGDTHPMHFHLVNVQLLSRQPFASYSNGTPTNLGKPRGPEPTELGWKETVKMHPGEITTVIMKFDLPVVPFKVPDSPRTGGQEYVWHCHILEHEEHDMMRPLIVR